MTTVLPFTTWVVVVVVTPDALVVATEWATRGPFTPFVTVVGLVPVEPDTEVDGAVGAVTGTALCARATAVAPVPTISAAAVQLDIRRTRRRPSVRDCLFRSSSPGAGSGTPPPPGVDPANPGSGTRPLRGLRSLFITSSLPVLLRPSRPVVPESACRHEPTVRERCEASHLPVPSRICSVASLACGCS